LSQTIDIRHVHVAPAAHGPPRLPRLLAVGLELLVAAGLSFGFFGLFLAMLTVVFPSALSLGSLATDVRARPRAPARRRERARAVGDPASLAAQPLALLAVLRADVRAKSADAIAWSPAVDGQRLMERDGVQTGAEGRARLDFGPGGEIHLEPNSLIILGAATKEPGDAGARRSVLVREGEIWARLDEAASATVRIALGNGVLRPSAAGHGSPAEFRVHARREGGGTISVVRGSVAFASKSHSVRLQAGQLSQVSAAGDVGPALKMPPTPQPVRPSERSVFRFRRHPPQIEFRWAAMPRVERYRLVVVRGPSRRELVADERVAWPARTLGGLQAGEYQWRVSAIVGELEGVPSAWRTLTIVREAGEGDGPSPAPALQAPRDTASPAVPAAARPRRAAGAGPR